ncbi:uncharacterized protein LOC144634762 isoform X2 [Oculina patagonica]
MTPLPALVQSLRLDDEKEYFPTPQRNRELKTLNRCIGNVSDGRISPVRFQLNQPISDVAVSTRPYIKRKSKEVVETTLECIAPGQSAELLALLTTTPTTMESNPESKVMETLISLYEGATSWYTKRTILSIFVLHYTKTQLKAMVPGLTTWRIDQARKHAAFVGEGVSEEREPVIRYRLVGEKVDHFLDFISSPHYLQDVAYGTRKLKLSTGESIEIPDLVRTVISSRMVKVYQSYCREVDFNPLGRSTLFSILKICAASQKKSLAGLDNVTSEGASAFENLEEIVQKMASLGASLQWVDDVKQRLRTAKRYLKADYKLHVLEESPCADHCIRFALSSSADAQFKSACDHDHPMQCDRCLDCKKVTNDIIAELESEDICYSNLEQKEEMKYDAEKARERILEWKAHIVRAINQEKAKIDTLNNLTSEQALIVMDWAMKWLPRSYRETQKEWFGKKGISWHVSACITKAPQEETEFQVQTFIHVFEKCNQDWFAVSSILECVVQQLVKISPQIKEIFLRSDNAGCYHNASLMASAPAIAAKDGLTLRNYSFSESNSGKDVCDRKIAPLKAHVNRYLNEGHDVVTAQQLKEAIDSYGSVKGCRAAVIEVNEKKQTSGTHKFSGISQLINFQYTENGGMIVWRSFRIGEGRKISKQELSKMVNSQSETGVNIILPSCEPNETFGMLKKTAKKSSDDPLVDTSPSTPPPDDDESDVFGCPEEGCIKTFRTSQNLQRHLDFGRHQFKLHEESQYDHIRRKWAEHCLSLKPENPSYLLGASSSSQDMEIEVGMGWALPKSKRSNRFSDQVKKFLLEQFMIGEETGRKVTPGEAAKRMRSQRDTAGKLNFGKGEWLTVQQVTSYFSRLAAMKKLGQLPAAVESIEEDDIEAVVEQTQRYALRQRIYNQLTL